MELGIRKKEMGTGLRLFLFGFLLILASSFLLPLLAHAQAAQSGFVPLAPPPAGSKLADLYNSSGSLSDFVNSLFKFALTLGAMLAVLRLAYAGFLYMGSADMWSTKSQAKHVISNVVLGMLLLLGVWLILFQINPDILKLNALQNIKPAPTSGANAPGTNVTVTPDNPNTPDDTSCTLNVNGQSYPGLFQGGTCRFAP